MCPRPRSRPSPPYHIHLLRRRPCHLLSLPRRLQARPPAVRRGSRTLTSTCLTSPGGEEEKCRMWWCPLCRRACPCPPTYPRWRACSSAGLASFTRETAPWIPRRRLCEESPCTCAPCLPWTQPQSEQLRSSWLSGITHPRPMIRPSPATCGQTQYALSWARTIRQNSSSPTWSALREPSPIAAQRSWIICQCSRGSLLGMAPTLSSPRACDSSC
mmetsp:Transcript_27546/g.74137  ORF Transcript_27546/g.74137 Transcript_27546/m.74137 type:complete len:215 (+) Transcript_27546:695-1339(+)